MLKIAIQADPMERLQLASDSTFVLMLKAQARGHRLWHYTPDDLSYRQGAVQAVARPIQVSETDAPFTFGPPVVLDLRTDVDVVLMRQDPPFNMAYITATHLLEMIQPDTLVVNDPAQVRNAPEKLFVTRFLDLMPETLITRSLAAVREFQASYGDVVIKPLYGHAGAGVFHIGREDANVSALVELMTQTQPEPFMVQRFLPRVSAGDKRIMLVEGQFAGAINRVPREGEIRSNLAAGGRAEATLLSDREREICARVGPALRERGLLFVGIDVIDGFITEINVTCPTGIRAVDRLHGGDLAALIWDAIEARAG